jgi:hypothetical protein
MDALRDGVLKDFRSMSAYCDEHPEARLPGDGGKRYGFKLETEDRTYYVRCTTVPRDYFYIFAYDRQPAREQEQVKPSVLKQLRDAQKSPKPPRKAKDLDRSKDDIGI